MDKTVRDTLAFLGYHREDTNQNWEWWRRFGEGQSTYDVTYRPRRRLKRPYRIDWSADLRPLACLKHPQNVVAVLVELHGT